LSEALLQNLYIIVSIVSSAIGIAYAIRRVTRWFQNLDRQIRDMRVGLHAISSLVYALYSTFLKLYHRAKRSESLSVNDVISEVISSLGETGIKVVREIIEDYLQLSLKESESLDPDGEARKRELLRRFQEGRISYDEAVELQTLLEEQKRRHEAAGNIVAAFLVLVILLFLIAFLAYLATGKRESTTTTY
jgi:hypothetical protein